MLYKAFVINLIDLGGGEEEVGRQCTLIDTILGFNFDYTFLAIFEAYEETYAHIKIKSSIEGYSIAHHKDTIFLSKLPILGKHYKDTITSSGLSMLKVKLENVSVRLLHTTGIIPRNLRLNEAVRGRKNTLLIVSSSDQCITDKLKTTHDNLDGIAVLHGNRKYIDNFNVTSLSDLNNHRSVSFSLFINDEPCELVNHCCEPIINKETKIQGSASTISDFDNTPVLTRRQSIIGFSSDLIKPIDAVTRAGSRMSLNLSAVKREADFTIPNSAPTSYIPNDIEENEYKEVSGASKERSKRKISLRNILSFWKGKG